MRGIFSGCLLALALGGMAAPVTGKTFDNQQARQWEFELREFTCPLGGKRFTQAVTHPHMPLARFPDGSHMGDEWVDQQIPECPDSKLLILPDFLASDAGTGLLAYHDYTAGELARLPALLGTEEWQAMLGETRTLRAYWLAKQLDRPAVDRYQLLLHASWGAEDDSQRHTALEWQVADLPGLIDALGPTDDGADFARYYVVNALRELGRFDEALALLESIEAETPGARMANDPDAMFAPPPIAGPMRAAIVARDDDRFAIGLLSNDMANRICNAPDYSPFRGDHAARDCAAREEERARQQARMDAVFELLDDRPALEARCEAKADTDRNDVLAEACRRASHDRDWAAGQDMADKQPRETAAMCVATEEADRGTAQVSACSSYDTYRSYAIASLLAADDAAYAAICDVNTQVGTGPFSFACTEATRRRDRRQAVALWQDKDRLRAACMDKRALEQTYDGRNMACSAFERGDKNPWWFKSADGEDGASEPEPLHVAALPYARHMIAAEIAQRASSD